MAVALVNSNFDWIAGALKVTKNGASSRDFGDFKRVFPHGLNP
jgi:hypothetical protein